MHARMDTCAYVCMYGYMRVCMHVCIHARMYACRHYKYPLQVRILSSKYSLPLPWTPPLSPSPSPSPSPALPLSRSFTARRSLYCTSRSLQLLWRPLLLPVNGAQWALTTLASLTRYIHMLTTSIHIFTACIHIFTTYIHTSFTTGQKSAVGLDNFGQCSDVADHHQRVGGTLYVHHLGLWMCE